MSDEVENNPESIAFIGYRSVPPSPVEIDFGSRMFMVGFYSNKNCYFRAVNALNEKEAIAIAVERAILEGVNVYAIDFCKVDELEVIPDGDSELEDSTRADI